MNRAKFRKLADVRVREAGVLPAAKCYDGAYDPAGYAEAWRLIVSTPIVDEDGPLAAYQAFHEVSEAADPPIEFDLGELRAASRKDAITRALRSLGDRADDDVGRRFGGFSHNGVSFLGAYLGRAPARRRPAAR